MVLDEPNANETATKINGIAVLVSPELEGFTEGAVVDYEKSWYGRGFVVRGGAGC